jgi:hypothetical protein
MTPRGILPSAFVALLAVWGHFAVAVLYPWARQPALRVVEEAS